MKTYNIALSVTETKFFFNLFVNLKTIRNLFQSNMIHMINNCDIYDEYIQ